MSGTSSRNDSSSSSIPGAHRGGPQIIPRPDTWSPGGPPPWTDLTSAQRRLDIDRIAHRLAQRGDGRLLASHMPQEPGRTSAVLCALFEDDGETHVLLTRRSAAMRSHTREVSFPGGRRDEEDEDYIATALREAREEVNLDPASVTIIGQLDRFVTGGSGSLIHPYVAALDGPPRNLIANPDEVESIRIVALSELLSDRAWREELWTRNGSQARITFMELEGDTVWGATAAMLRLLFVISLDLES